MTDLASLSLDELLDDVQYGGARGECGAARTELRRRFDSLQQEKATAERERDEALRMVEQRCIAHAAFASECPFCDLDAAEARVVVLENALREIADVGCRYLARGDFNDCAHAGGGRGAQDQWCGSCIAAAALERKCGYDH